MQVPFPAGYPVMLSDITCTREVVYTLQLHHCNDFTCFLVFKVETVILLEHEQPKEEVPLWIYLVSAIGGLIVLVILVVALYFVS